MSVAATRKAWRIRGLSLSERLVLLYIATHASPQGRCSAHIKTIRARCEIEDPMLVGYLLDSLEAQRLIAREPECILLSGELLV